MNNSYNKYRLPKAAYGDYLTENSSKETGDKDAEWAARIRKGLGPEYANYNDEQIREVYDKSPNKLMTKFGEDSYVAPELDEFTITSETDKERRDAYSANAAKYFAENQHSFMDRTGDFLQTVADYTINPIIDGVNYIAENPVQTVKDVGNTMADISMWPDAAMEYFLNDEVTGKNMFGETYFSNTEGAEHLINALPAASLSKLGVTGLKGLTKKIASNVSKNRYTNASKNAKFFDDFERNVNDVFNKGPEETWYDDVATAAGKQQDLLSASPYKNFKSEIDWGKWNKEIPDDKPLMKEYNAIEKSSKADGTWMKNPDGSDFTGVPEQFVERQSAAFKETFPEGYDKMLRGDIANWTDKANWTNKGIGNPTLTKLYKGPENEGLGVFLTPTEEVAKEYGNGQVRRFGAPFKGDVKDLPNGGIYELAIPKTKQAENLNVYAQGDHWTQIPTTKGGVEIGLEKLNFSIAEQEERLAMIERNFREAGEYVLGSPFQSTEEIKKMAEAKIKQLKGKIKKEKDLKKKLIKNKDKYATPEGLNKIEKELLDIRGWTDDSGLLSTDAFATYIENKPNLLRANIDNIVDGAPAGDIVINKHIKGNYPKSLWGNNGKWDQTNPNIYKALIPAVGVGSLGAASQKAYGGEISTNNNRLNNNTMLKKGNYGMYIPQNTQGQFPQNTALSLAPGVGSSSLAQAQAMQKRMQQQQLANTPPIENNFDDRSEYMADGGSIPSGFHMMPDGTMMPGNKHKYKHGGPLETGNPIMDFINNNPKEAQRLLAQQKYRESIPKGNYTVQSTYDGNLNSAGEYLDPTTREGGNPYKTIKDYGKDIVSKFTGENTNNKSIKTDNISFSSPTAFNYGGRLYGDRPLPKANFGSAMSGIGSFLGSEQGGQVMGAAAQLAPMVAGMFNKKPSEADSAPIPKGPMLDAYGNPMTNNPYANMPMRPQAPSYGGFTFGGMNGKQAEAMGMPNYGRQFAYGGSLPEYGFGQNLKDFGRKALDGVTETVGSGMKVLDPLNIGYGTSLSRGMGNLVGEDRYQKGWDQFTDGSQAFTGGAIKGVAGVIPGVGGLAKQGLNGLDGIANKALSNDDYGMLYKGQDKLKQTVGGVGEMAGAVGAGIFTGNVGGAVGSGLEGFNSFSQGMDMNNDWEGAQRNGGWSTAGNVAGGLSGLAGFIPGGSGGGMGAGAMGGMFNNGGRLPSYGGGGIGLPGYGGDRLAAAQAAVLPVIPKAAPTSMYYPQAGGYKHGMGQNLRGFGPGNQMAYGEMFARGGSLPSFNNGASTSEEYLQQQPGKGTNAWDATRETAAGINPIVGAFHEIGSAGATQGQNMIDNNADGTVKNTVGEALRQTADPMSNNLRILENNELNNRQKTSSIASQTLTGGFGGDDWFGLVKRDKKVPKVPTLPPPSTPTSSMYDGAPNANNSNFDTRNEYMAYGGALPSFHNGGEGAGHPHENTVYSMMNNSEKLKGAPSYWGSRGSWSNNDEGVTTMQNDLQEMNISKDDYLAIQDQKKLLEIEQAKLRAYYDEQSYDAEDGIPVDKVNELSPTYYSQMTAYQNALKDKAGIDNTNLAGNKEGNQIPYDEQKFGFRHNSYRPGLHAAENYTQSNANVSDYSDINVDKGQRRYTKEGTEKVYDNQNQLLRNEEIPTDRGLKSDAMMFYGNTGPIGVQMDENGRKYLQGEDGSNLGYFGEDFARGGYTNRYADGGYTQGQHPASQYIAEKDEMVYHPNDKPLTLANGGLNQVANNYSKITGDKHSAPSGGVEMAGGKDGYIYSDQLKVPKDLYNSLKGLI